MKDLISKSDDWDSLRAELRQNFRSVYREEPGFEQLGAWKSSIEHLASLFRPLTELHDLVVLEYRLPFSGERIDAVLLGAGHSGKPTAFIAEFKGWRSAKPHSTDFVLADIGKQVHPEYQLRNYIGKIIHSHSAADLFDVDGCVLMYNLGRADSRISFHCKHFYKGEEDRARQQLMATFAGPIDEATAGRFVNGQYLQSQKLFDAIRTHFDEIRNASNTLLAEKGYGLSIEQLSLVDEIIDTIRDRREGTYLIQGAPGSGKTLVALHLLLRGLSEGKQSVLTYRNNRLIASLRKATSEPSRDAHIDMPIKFYSTGRPGNPGLAEAGYRGQKFDLAIFDEAQRMTIENIDLALLRAKVTVFLYDESQILNADEEGTTYNFQERASSQGKVPIIRNLTGIYRVLGGRAYHDWVESLLSNPRSTEAPPIFGGYDFRVLQLPQDLFGILKAKRDGHDKPKVGLMAAFTETPGDPKDPRSTRNLRISNQLPTDLDVYSGFSESVYWLMDPKKDYVPFWVNGGSNRLDQCASIYGCQGFEVDYAGVIWGRDLVLRNGEWEVGNYCEDGKTGRPSLKQIMRRAKENSDSKDLALRLLKNRYRIFLTRGIKGTYVFCEDKETLQSLRNLTAIPAPVSQLRA